MADWRTRKSGSRRQRGKKFQSKGSGMRGAARTRRSPPRKNYVFEFGDQRYFNVDGTLVQTDHYGHLEVDSESMLVGVSGVDTGKKFRETEEDLREYLLNRRVRPVDDPTGNSSSPLFRDGDNWAYEEINDELHKLPCGEPGHKHQSKINSDGWFYCPNPEIQAEKDAIASYGRTYKAAQKASYERLIKRMRDDGVSESEIQNFILSKGRLMKE